MITFMLAFLAIALTYIAVKSSYPWLKFMAGAMWIAFGVWLIYNPLMVGSNPLNDIMLPIVFIGGIAIMFSMNWRTDKDGNGSFNLRIPAIFGGKSESDETEQAQRNARTWRDRRDSYMERMDRRRR